MVKEERIWQGKSQQPNLGSWVRLVHGRKYNLTIRERRSGLVRVDVREIGLDESITLTYKDWDEFLNYWSKPRGNR